MKRAFVLSLTLLIGSAALAAQNSAPKRPKVPPLTPPETGVCPVMLHARQAAAGSMVAVDKDHPKGTAQRLLITLPYPDSRAITRARITVRGLSAKRRITPAPARSHRTPDSSRTFDVALQPGPVEKTASADLWVPGMTSVSTVELNSVSFADGSMWTFAGRASCRFVPDPVMLIADR